MVNAMQTVICLLLGLVAGVAGGLFGIGGGIIIVPTLVYALGYSQHRAQGTSLVALLAPVGLLGVWNYYRAGNADIRAGILIAAGFVLGVYGGSKLALDLNELVMRRAFAVFLLLVAVQLFLKK